jgi:hypothetical protein
MDIDFMTDLSNGDFRISLGSNPTGVSGNRALLNRFEIVFLTKKRQFIYGNSYVADQFGGDAVKFISQPQVINDIQSISASLAIAVEQTVKSILGDQQDNIPDTEKLVAAELISVDVIGDMVTASIEVMPAEVESYDLIRLNLPITKV